MLVDRHNEPQSWLIVVSGWTGAGKSTIADLIAAEVAATVVSFDWIMSGLRTMPAIWPTIERPVEVQRRAGWNLLSRVAEQQLRRGASCVLDLVAREEARVEWHELAARYGARFLVVECLCSDLDVHRSRIEGRDRDIPGWYELDWEQVQRGRTNYAPLNEPKLLLDAVDDLATNLELVRAALSDPSNIR